MKKKYKWGMLLLVCFMLGIGLAIPIFTRKEELESDPFMEPLAVDPPSDHAEVIEKRTRSSKTFDLGNNKFSWDGSIGSIHYKDEFEQWQEINNSFEPALSPWNWQMLNAGYHVRVKGDFTSGQIIEFEKQGETVQFQPMALEWTNDLEQIQQVSMSQSVLCDVTNPEVDLLPTVGMPSCQGTIRWNDSYGEGLNFEWKCTSTRLCKVLEIESFSNLSLPEQYILDGGNPVLRLNLIFAPSSDMDIYVDGELWDKKVKKQTFNAIEFKKDGEVLWGFMPLKYWDSGEGENNTGHSVAILEKRGNKLYVSVRVPYGWLQDAIYPIFIDVDVDEQVGASTDDAREDNQLGAGTMYVTADYMVILKETQYAGVRFTGVNIPSGSTINSNTNLSVYLPDDTDDFFTNKHIYCQNVNNPVTFSAAAHNISTRVLTTAYTTLTAGAMGVGWEYTPSLSDEVQEVVTDQSGTGDALVFIITSTGTEDLEIQAWDFDPNLAAKLHIEYSAGGAAPTVDYKFPVNGSTGIGLTPKCKAYCNDTDADSLTVTWGSNYSDGSTWVNYHTNNSVTAGTIPAYTFAGFNAYNTKYWWRVYVYDGTDNISEIYHFTTAPRSWEQIDKGWLSFDTVKKNWEQISKGWLSFTTPSKGWNQISKGWLSFSNTTSGSATFSHYKLITINSANVTADLTDYVLYVHWDADADIAAVCTGAEDIGFFNETGETQLDSEIDYFDPSTGEIHAYVRIPTLSSSVDTEIRIYYLDSDSTSEDNKDGCWNASYIAVYHFSNASWIDSSGNGYDLTGHLVGTADSLFHKGADLEIDNHSYLFNNATKTWAAKDTVTMQMWVNYESLGDAGYNRHAGICAGRTYTDDDGIQLKCKESTSTEFRMKVCSGDDTSRMEAQCGEGPIAGTWIRATGTASDDVQYAYAYSNGTNKASDGPVDVDWTGFASNDITIGRNGDYYVDGIIDEVRIMDMMVSDAFIATTYDNERNATGFITVTSPNAPTVTHKTPGMGELNVESSPTCRAWVNDSNGDTLNATWASNHTGAWVNYHTNFTVVANSTVSYDFAGFTAKTKKYFWRVYADDGTYNESEDFYFHSMHIMGYEVNVTIESESLLYHSAQYDGRTNCSYIAFQEDANNKIYVMSWNHSTNSVQSGPHHICSNGPDYPSTKGLPSIVVAANGTIYIFYYGHSSAGWWGWTNRPITDPAFNLDEWDVDNLFVDGSYTYHAAYITTNGSIYYTIRRTITLPNPRVVDLKYSYDNGSTWSTVERFIDPQNEIYTSDWTHRLMNGHDTFHFSLIRPDSHDNLGWHDLYYLYFNATNRHLYNVSGYDLGINASWTEITDHCLVYDTGPNDAGEDECFLTHVDIDANYNPHIVFLWNNRTNADNGTNMDEDLLWRYTYWNGTHWLKNPINITTTHTRVSVPTVAAYTATNVDVFLSTLSDFTLQPLKAWGQSVSRWNWNGDKWTENVIHSDAGSSVAYETHVMFSSDTTVDFRLYPTAADGKYMLFPGGGRLFIWGGEGAPRNEWNQLNEGWLSFNVTGKKWEQTDKGWLNFDTTKKSWNQCSEGWLNFTTTSSPRIWNQTDKGYLIFTTTGRSWNQRDSGWLNFTTAGRSWNQRDEGWLNFTTMSKSWNQLDEGWLSFTTPVKNWEQITVGWLSFTAERSWNQLKEGWLVFDTTKKHWEQNSTGWLKFSNLSTILTSCFTATQTGNTVRFDAECSVSETEYKWSFIHPTLGEGTTDWCDDSTWVVSLLEEGRIYMTLEVRDAAGNTDSVTSYYDFGDTRDILEYWEYKNMADCEDAGFYWYDMECHDEPKPDWWDDYGEGPGNQSSPDTYEPPVPIKPGGWRIPPELILIGAIILAVILLNQRRKKDAKRISILKRIKTRK